MTEETRKKSPATLTPTKEEKNQRQKEPEGNVFQDSEKGKSFKEETLVVLMPLRSYEIGT